MTKRRMRIAFPVTKATNTRPEYVILIAFPLQQRLHERPKNSVLYAHCLSCIYCRLAEGFGRAASENYYVESITLYTNLCTYIYIINH
jgi:hypothetical protein